MVRKGMFIVVAAVLLQANGSPSAAPPAQTTVKVEATLLDIPTSEMKKLPLGAGRKETPATEAWALKPQQMEALRADLRSGKVTGRLLSLASVTALDGKEAVVTVTEKIHYMQKVGEDTFLLRVLKHEAVRFAVTPTVTGDRVLLALDLRVSKVEGRVPVPEAPDLDIGHPALGSTAVRTTVSVKSGETIVVAGHAGAPPKAKEPISSLWLVTAKIEK